MRCGMLSKDSLLPQSVASGGVLVGDRAGSLCSLCPWHIDWIGGKVYRRVTHSQALAWFAQGFGKGSSWRSVVARSLGSLNGAKEFRADVCPGRMLDLHPPSSILPPLHRLHQHFDSSIVQISAKLVYLLTRLSKFKVQAADKQAENIQRDSQAHHEHEYEH